MTRTEARVELREALKRWQGGDAEAAADVTDALEGLCEAVVLHERGAAGDAPCPFCGASPIHFADAADPHIVYGVLRSRVLELQGQLEALRIPQSPAPARARGR